MHVHVSPRGSAASHKERTMPIINESSLSTVLLKEVPLRLIEPHIYSVSPNAEHRSFFDSVARFYDVVICNPLYNRLVWGYSVMSYAPFTQNALTSSPDGWVLDAGCGSLAFNARTYSHFSDRPVVFIDESLKLLRMAKSRLAKLNGTVPGNMVFLHGDALACPFKPKSFKTIISLNLLHVIDDLKKALPTLKNALAEKGTMFFTTLVENSRLADNYLRWVLKKTCGVAPRTIGQLQAVFDEAGMPIDCDLKGNMAFIHYG